MRRVLVALVLVVTACGGGSDESEATTRAPVQTGAGSPTSAPDGSVGPACDAFLAFRGAQDPDAAFGALDLLEEELGSGATAGMVAAFEAFRSGDFGPGGIGEVIGAMRDQMIPLCRDRYFAGVTAATDDAAAAESFFAAVVAGDRAAAATIAQAEVVAQFEPWLPFGDDASLTLGDGGFTMQLTPESRLECETRNGVVERCFRS
jgi:hypothetical protein